MNGQSGDAGDKRRPPHSRKPYKAPALQQYGKLSRLTQGSSGPDNDGMGTQRTKTKMTMTMSDRRSKQNIVQIGTLPNGISLYLFDYREESGPHESGRQLGVMADEVEPVMPHAVTESENGYKLVNYALLNIETSDVIAAFGH